MKRDRTDQVSSQKRSAILAREQETMKRKRSRARKSRLLVIVALTAGFILSLSACVEPVSLLEDIENAVASARPGNEDGDDGSIDGGSGTLSVAYDGNGNTSGKAPNDINSYAPGDSVTVLGNSGALTLTDYVFVGWNTEADGSGTTYQAGVTFSIGTEDVVLYARWSYDPLFFVTYDGNGHNGGDVPVDAHEYVVNATVTVKNAGTIFRTGYSFGGWNANAVGDDVIYGAGDEFVMPAQDVTFLAVWDVNSYTVQYHGNGHDGGSVPAQQSGDYNTTILVKHLDTLSRYGHEFLGWNDQQEGTGGWYDPDDPFVIPAKNTTLYAQWDPYEVGDPGPAGGTVFFVDDGDSFAGWDYLEVAPVSTEWGPPIGWGEIGDGTPNLSTSTEIGEGENNTVTILTWLNGNSITGMAAQLCDGLNYGGEGDWFLPSLGELELISQNVNDGTFSSTWYWSSSDDLNTGRTSFAWTWDMSADSPTSWDKAGEGEERVRAVRSF